MERPRQHAAIGAVLTGVALIVAACGEGDAEPSSVEATTTTTQATTTTTTEAAASDSAPPSDPTTSETQVEAPADDGEAPAAGTGVLTLDGADIVFAIVSCSSEPTVQQATGAIQLFTMRGEGMAEGRDVAVNAATIEFAGRTNDNYGYSYADDPSDFETAVIVGTGGSGGDLFDIDGTTYRAGPVPFERVEGVSVVEDVDPGEGSIRFTC